MFIIPYSPLGAGEKVGKVAVKRVGKAGKEAVGKFVVV